MEVAQSPINVILHALLEVSFCTQRGASVD